MVELREINKDNLEDILELRVSESQRGFVSSVAYSLAQAWVYRQTAFPFAVYADERPVGFVMLGYYEARNQYTLWKFLIDERYQHQGYGRKALQLAIGYLTENFDTREIYTGVSLGNGIARHLYQSAGFIATGLVEDNMEEMRVVCEKQALRAEGPQEGTEIPQGQGH
ncbi:MAG: GNAT family N-acetyltransferase [Provencibacterium sp.]|jgi:diamine N-acetyltransferase|nr:GNAT family N-acetyltransferase [Provencibacterium sp.]